MSSLTPLAAGRWPLSAVAQTDIDILKEASADGLTFFDANAAGGSDVPVVTMASTATYRITVANIGDVLLIDAVVQDDQLGVNLNLGDLAIWRFGDLAVGESAVLDGLSS